jgi:hypothetical protein
MKEMLLKEKNVDWESLHIYKKRGAAVIKTKTFIDKSELEYTPKAGALETFNGKQGIWRNKWFIDTGIPEFKGEDRDYIDKLVNI